MTIIPFSPQYQDALITMILDAKRALGRQHPTLKPDLLDIPANYFDRGDMFWIALDESGQLIASLGYSSIPDTTEVWLHRFYVKHDRKRQGIGSAVLAFAEAYLKDHGKTCIHVHLGADYYESHSFYPKHGYHTYAPLYMKKEI